MEQPTREELGEWLQSPMTQWVLNHLEGMRRVTLDRAADIGGNEERLHFLDRSRGIKASISTMQNIADQGRSVSDE